jgi:hypothetical protein
MGVNLLGLPQSMHEVVFERHLGEGPPRPQSNAISIALGSSEPSRPAQWEWRCSCGASGAGSHETVIMEWRQHEYLSVSIMHVRSQDGQPYGSERRCCNHCGIMLPDYGGLLLQGEVSAPYVDNWTNWRDHPNNCGRRIPKEAS